MVPPARTRLTSAEPNRFDSPWDELRVCRETVLADWDEVPGEIADECRHSVQEVRAAGLRVERAVQERLRALGGPGVTITDRRYMRGLWDASWQRYRAIVAVTGRPLEAKVIQREAAAGRPPLSVCAGRRVRRLPEHVLRNNAPDIWEDGGSLIWAAAYGDGCGVIILDSSEPRPPNKYCEDCAKKAGNTMNAGLAKNALARLRASRK
jgi:hypothetical protein